MAVATGGAAVVALRKTGSAFIAPAHPVRELMDGLRGAVAEPLPVSRLLHGAAESIRGRMAATP